MQFYHTFLIWHLFECCYCDLCLTSRGLEFQMVKGDKKRPRSRLHSRKLQWQDAKISSLTLEQCTASTWPPILPCRSKIRRRWTSTPSGTPRGCKRMRPVKKVDYNTVWKFMNFSATQNLREFNNCSLRNCNFDNFGHSEV